MATTGTFVTEDAFCITGRGWVLVGQLSGTVVSGQQLVFENGVILRIKAVELMNIRNTTEKISFVLEDTFASRQELLDQSIIGATARIIA